MFREAILSFFGADAQKKPQNDYCSYCKAAGKDDCDKCSKEITWEQPKKK